MSATKTGQILTQRLVSRLSFLLALKSEYSLTLKKET